MKPPNVRIPQLSLSDFKVGKTPSGGEEALSFCLRLGGLFVSRLHWFCAEILDIRAFYGGGAYGRVEFSDCLVRCLQAWRLIG